MELLPRCLSNTFSYKDSQNYTNAFIEITDLRHCRDTYGLEITVDDILLVQELKALHKRVCKSPYETETETLVIVLLYQLIQVQAVKKIVMRTIMSQIINHLPKSNILFLTS